MLFNSIDFAIFLPIVFAIYWLIGKSNVRGQNAFLLAASYFFYGWWDFRFLSLIAFSSLVDYFAGKKINTSSSKNVKRLFLIISIIVNLGFLGFFKYFNFFADNFAHAFSLMGTSFDPVRLKIILPVGISFYTFQTLSYTIDVYRGKLKPTNDIIAFFSFVSFFPQLVAGPIERALNLLPQFHKKRSFDYNRAVDGVRQILWGLFKKLVIADNCAIYVNDVFANYESHTGLTLILAAILFAFQIYGDFSGYSDIAIGTARLFGFNLMKNFAFPYFSRDIAEFWRRWHISLSTWFRDYLYIPLGGSKGSKYLQVRNVLIVFVVSGFWHGANWTFIVWGALHATFYLPLLLLKRNRSNTNLVAENKLLPNPKEIIQISITFILTTIAWVFFRANDIEHAFSYLHKMIQIEGGIYVYPIKQHIISILFFILIEWIQRSKEHAGDVRNYPKWVRYSFYIIVFLFIFILGNFDANQFIYFQF